ncbi:MAG: ABC transporter substrate-binding protein [Pseudanabaenaceae cyanobacterium]
MSTARFYRRQVLRAGAGFALAAIAGRSWQRAQDDPGKIPIGYWPSASGLPFFWALQQEEFARWGVTVEPVPFTTTRAAVAALVHGQVMGLANVPAAATLALLTLGYPDLFRVVAVLPRYPNMVLDGLMTVANRQPKARLGVTAERFPLAVGQRLFPQAQWVPLSIAEAIAAMQRGQIDGFYSLDPLPVGNFQPETTLSQTLLAGEWLGGLALLRHDFCDRYPTAARRVVAGFQEGIAAVQREGLRTLSALAGYAQSAPDLRLAVWLSRWQGPAEWHPPAIAQWQANGERLHRLGILPHPVPLTHLLYRG